ncbi:hypothetical protein [Humibacillus xanthopallidus]|uniref:DUF4386 family protein n=1 Tax=Humibacillus xanthopallidus TaxID=412689 RepID=A0A543HI15_9MICO|nr:hypothetical protein [Humibacillus xanthopallidus]TQM57959.1 hypothetical protein FBY41_3311 [Humibacillus xanthopallidus]
MTTTPSAQDRSLRRLSTPRAAGLAGVAFALLFATSLALLRSVTPEDPFAGTPWTDDAGGRIRVALSLMPFAGIAFLWFIGVIRDQLGELEDRFFASVFLGSGLLFLAMIFVSLAVAGALLAGIGAGGGLYSGDTVSFGRAVMLQIGNVYALRMAGVFMISLGTIWMRTGLMPRWLAAVTFVLAALLLFVINLSLWTGLVFPGWVLVVSLLILARQRRA